MNISDAGVNNKGDAEKEVRGSCAKFLLHRNYAEATGVHRRDICANYDCELRKDDKDLASNAGGSMSETGAKYMEEKGPLTGSSKQCVWTICMK